MAENDFLRRRSVQLHEEGRTDLAHRLAQANEGQDQNIDGGPEGVNFIYAYAHIVRTLAGLLQYGYRPEPDLYREQRSQLERLSNAELFTAVFRNDTKTIQANPIYYSVLTDLIAERDANLVRVAGTQDQGTKA